MLKLIVGTKGSGKTKTMIDMIDKAVMVSRCGLPDEERIDDIETRAQKPVNYLSTVLARKR